MAHPSRERNFDPQPSSAAWFRLKWITDIAALLHRVGPEEAERLYARSQQLGAGRAPAQALLLARRIYGDLVGPALLDRLKRDWQNRWLTKFAWHEFASRQALTEPTERRLGTLMMRLSQLLLMRGWRFKLSEARRQVVEVSTRRVPEAARKVAGAFAPSAS